MSDYYDRYNGMENLLSTNLAEVGTDVPDKNVGELISREQAVNAFNTNVNELVVAGKENADSVLRYLNRVINEIKQLPPIQPEIVRCKDCKHWKDSDGVFRRGMGVESKCPLNLHQVYEGTFYCGLGERREVNHESN